MADSQSEVIKYTGYFNILIPNAMVQVAILLMIGAISGIISSYIIHESSSSFPSFVLFGAGAGLLLISLPSMISSMMFKAIRRKIKLKHILFATLTVSAIYGLILIITAMVYSISKDYVVAVVLLILGNAGMYGYWFFMNKIVLGLGKSSLVFSFMQPLLNLLLYVPFGKYIFTLDMPLSSLLVKLYAGMLVFLGMGYFIIYLLDRPSKKMLNVSGLAIFAVMVQQWLYNLTPNADLTIKQGVYRDVNVKVLSLHGKSGGAVFIKPDIHYGPFSNVGGSIVTEAVGTFVREKYNATPFIMHGAVNAGDNPISAQQITGMKKRIGETLDSFNLNEGTPAKGTFSIGSDGPCRAINLQFNDINMVSLTKAPLVTEDIDHEVGKDLESLVGSDPSKVILIDSHNSRRESESGDELRGVYKGSKYVESYSNAILDSLKNNESTVKKRVLFGSSCLKLRHTLPGSKDIGPGYTSVGIFGFGNKHFAMIYFDANNMLPSFRDDIINHVKKKFRMDAEVYTTDTHAVNTIALPASNALGRHTRANQIIPLLDSMIYEAKKKSCPVSVFYDNFTMKKFKVWGEGADELILKAGREGIRILKHVVPIVVGVGFVIAAWVIYTV